MALLGNFVLSKKKKKKKKKIFGFEKLMSLDEWAEKIHLWSN
jgi:hypothetical protein